jgi:amino acid adenylation domain-containing protein
VISYLRQRALRQPTERAYVFLSDGETEQASLSYAELDGAARAVAAHLQAAGAKGERVLLFYPPGLEFVAAFFGCLYAGAVAVPLYPPRLNRSLIRVQSIITDAEAKFALTTSRILSRADTLFEQSSELSALSWLSTDDLVADVDAEWLPSETEPDALAYLQYTSGSTATPKGIMISHANLMHNSAYLDRGWRHTEQSRIVSWLPHFHDMGLVYGIVQPLYKGFPGYLVPPAVFLQRPMLWLRAISRYRATHSAAPNFAYDLCVRKFVAEECEDIDLSCWRVAVNGAEPVRRSTLEQFGETFARYGFRTGAFCPGYGLAEATLKVAAREQGERQVFRAVESSALAQHRVAVATEGEPNTQTLTGCGRVMPEANVLIVNPETLVPCAPDEVGEVWVSGPSVAPGYWNRPEETEQTFKARPAADESTETYLRTGDLGFVLGDELFLTGRFKDLIIIRGRNHYPQDIELTTERSHAALRPGCGAAFSVEVAGEERLVVVQEVARHYGETSLEEVVGSIRRDIAEAHELQAYAVVLVKTGSVPKTSSGKIQRHACRAGFLAERLSVVGQSILEAEPNDQSGETLSRADILEAEADARTPMLVNLLREELARMLKVSPSSLGPSRPLNTFGIDSLTALELKNWMEARLGVSIATTNLLAGASIIELADELLARLTDADGARAEGYNFPRQTIGEHPLSFGQRALWLTYLLDRDSCAYNIAYGAHVRTEVDAEAMRRACQALVYRHALLRTAYVMSDGQPLQSIREHQTVHFECVDASHLDDAKLDELLTEEADRPFELENGVVLRVKLFTRSAQEHLLLLTVHHIACDFWSLDILASELRALYEAEAGELKAALEPIELQYTDFAFWQAEMLARAEGERLWAYWQKQLEGELPVLNLPADRPRPPVQSFGGASFKFDLSDQLERGLKSLSKSEGTTLYMTVLAAFYVLLYRHSGQGEILIGSPMAGRSRPEFEGIVGHLVNPTVLRANLSGEMNFRSLLRDVRGIVLGAMAHQDYPLSLLAERLQPARDASISPFFQVAFAWEQPRRLRAQEASARESGKFGSGAAAGSLGLKDFLWRQGGAPYDLLLMVLDEGDSLSCTLQYRTDLFEQDRISRMAGHLERLLAAAVTDPNLKLSEMPLLTEEEQRLLLEEWNPTAEESASGACLHELFREQAARTPDAVAAQHGDEQLSYGELDRRSEKIARYLREHGVGAEEVVGLYLPRSLRQVEAVIGVLKSGGAYLPLDTTSPSERVRMMVEDAGVRVVLSESGDEEAVAGLRESGVQVIGLGREWESIESEINSKDEDAVRSSVSEQNSAYVIYTSGSTGRPKGVMVKHSGVVNLLMDFERRQPLAAGDACSFWTSLSFDVSVYEIFSALLAGGTLHIVPEHLRTQSGEVLKWMERHGIQSAYIPPFMLGELAERLKAKTIRLALKRLLVGVEPIQEQTLAEVSASLPGLKIVNGYGPTEATVCATLYDLSDDGARSGNTPIGKPTLNTGVYLLDERLNPVPIGTAGELYISGDGLAHGYLGRPELTAEKFIPLPFAAKPGARMYRSGDLARHQPDGNIEFLGRLDQQVKVHGARVELGEIEAALKQSPAILDGVVTVKEDARGEKRLVAYVVAASEQSPAPAELRRLLQGKLPSFMMPSAFVFLDSIPQTRNGKIDRKALPAPGKHDFIRAGKYAAPRTPVEEVLAGIWEEVLGVERVGVDDDFFELGGHSLLATRITARIRETFKVEISLQHFFETPSVGGLSGKIEAAVRSGQEFELPPIQRLDAEGELPPSFAQRRLWFLEQMEPGSPVYNMPAALRLTGPLNAAALEQAVSEVVRRHGALRTAFMNREQPVQVVCPAKHLSLSLIDLSDLPEDSHTETAHKLMHEEGARPFDLGRAPLLRLSLVRLTATEHLLLITLHHIISDGWSMSVFLRELVALYTAYTRGQESTLPELALQYPDYAIWEQERLTDEALAPHLSYWRERLAGAPYLLDLPADKMRRHTPGWAGAAAPLALGRELSEGLKVLSRREGVTPFMVLLAAFQALLSRYTGLEDFLVGTPTAGREATGLEPLIGLFVNTLVLRADLSGDPSFRGLLGRVREQCLSAYTHQSMPFERLVEGLGVERSLSHTPLIQVMCALGEDPLRGLSWPGLKVRREAAAESLAAKFDLTLAAEETEGGEYTASLEYRTDLFEHERIARMGEHLRRLLEAAVADPNLKLSEMPLLSEEERKRLVTGWNQTQADYGAGVCAHELFARQMTRTPEAVAAEDEQGQVTYAELDRRAERIAHYLRSQGVGVEAVVALYLPRSLRLIEAVLGVLKAGGAYLPLDTSSPSERVRMMVEDAGVRVVLSESGDEEAVAGLRELGVRVIGVGREWESIESEVSSKDEEDEASSSVVPAGSAVSAENLAYVIYTSGSTGRPKGVMVTHGGLVNLIRWHQNAFGVTPADRATQLASTAFDASVWELWPYLCAGASVHIPADEIQFSPVELRDWLSARAITMTFMPTPLTESLLELDWSKETALRLMLTGGDRLQHYPPDGAGFDLVNNYGPTECTVVATSGLVSSKDKRDAPPSIGRPIGNTQVYVLDSRLRVAPTGVPGQLCVGGRGLMRGYLGRPELTAERLRPDDFSGAAGSRLYLTSDRARHLADGRLEFLGRSDRQLKLRGYRIEPGEIEAALCEHEAVRQAVVMLVEGAGGGRLVAYVVREAGRDEACAAELSAHLRRRVPEYMVPVSYVMLDEMPLTSSGKIDRARLPRPDETDADEGDAVVRALSAVEEVVARVWEEVLGVERVKAGDDFFALGGHSLLAARVVGRVRERLGVEVGVRRLFESPTLAAFAESLGEVNAHAEARAPLITPLSRELYRAKAPAPEKAEVPKS